MTLEEVMAYPGAHVVYKDEKQSGEGIICGERDGVVFVRFEGEQGARPCKPEYLFWRE